jgi:uncharacterized protein YcfJ
MPPQLTMTLRKVPLRSAAQGGLVMNKNNVFHGVSALLAVTALAAVTGCQQSPGSAPAAVAKAAPVAREECHDETVTLTREPKDRKQIAGTAVGAVIGGVLGNQIGKGDGKKLATVGGAAVGGYAGNKIQENAQEKNTYTETKRVCKTVYDNG